jgi:hypothetical protein
LNCSAGELAPEVAARGDVEHDAGARLLDDADRLAQVRAAVERRAEENTSAMSEPEWTRQRTGSGVLTLPLHQREELPSIHR